MMGFLRLSQFGLLTSGLLISMAATGCASTPAATTPIRFSELGTGRVPPLALRVPFVIEFQAGDQLPVDFEFNSEDFELSPARPTMTLIAKQHCFVQFSNRGIRSSLDSHDFPDKGKKPGSFRLGLHVERGQPPKLDVGITTPRR
jgi:hypothetical protein